MMLQNCFLVTKGSNISLSQTPSCIAYSHDFVKRKINTAMHEGLLASFSNGLVEESSSAGLEDVQTTSPKDIMAESCSVFQRRKKRSSLNKPFLYEFQQINVNGVLMSACPSLRPTLPTQITFFPKQRSISELKDLSLSHCHQLFIHLEECHGIFIQLYLNDF